MARKAELPASAGDHASSAGTAADGIARQVQRDGQGLVTMLKRATNLATPKMIDQAGEAIVAQVDLETG